MKEVTHWENRSFPIAERDSAVTNWLMTGSRVVNQACPGLAEVLLCHSPTTVPSAPSWEEGQKGRVSFLMGLNTGNYLGLG